MSHLGRLYIEHAHDQIFKLEFLAKNTHTREYAHEYGEYGLSEFTYLSTNSHVHSNIFILVKAAVSNCSIQGKFLRKMNRLGGFG